MASSMPRSSCCPNISLSGFTVLVPFQGPAPSQPGNRAGTGNQELGVSHSSRGTVRSPQLPSCTDHAERASSLRYLSLVPHTHSSATAYATHITQAAPLSWPPTILLPGRNRMRGSCTGGFASSGPPVLLSLLPQHYCMGLPPTQAALTPKTSPTQMHLSAPSRRAVQAE